MNNWNGVMKVENYFTSQQSNRPKWKGILFEVPILKLQKEKIGFIGENGVGATTFFSAIQSRVLSNIKRGTSIGYLGTIIGF